MADTVPRQVRGEMFGKVLADFLNRTEQRANRLLRRRVRVKKHKIAIFFEQLGTLERVPAMPPSAAREKLACSLQRSLNRHLREYLQRPQIRLAQDSRPFIIFESVGKHRFTEHIAVDALGGLLREGLLARMRRCARCGRWYFARKEDSYYCKRKCQTTSTEEAKARKREYMKDYYQLRKLGKVKVWRRAK